MEYVKDLLEFLSTVINTWAAYVTGGVAIALLWLWSSHQQRPISKKLAMTAAIVFLVLAFFTSWRAQKNLRLSAEHARVKVEKERDQLIQARTPDLALSIDEIGAGSASIGKMSHTGVFITASLVNHGAPSIAEGWWLKATLLDGPI